MKTNRIVLGLSIVAVSALLACCLAGCGGPKDENSGKVAATVNDEIIYENRVTNYVEQWRESYGLSSDSTWESYLNIYGMTSEDLRNQVLTIYINEAAVRIACEYRGIEVTDEEIDENIATLKAQFTDESAWAKGLEENGWTEEQYREKVKQGLLEDKLVAALTSDEEVSDATILEFANAHLSEFDGMKRSSHILFDLEDKETAQEVLDKINNGELEFEDAAKEYSQDGSASKGGDVGWDKLSMFVDEYQGALDKLGKDEMSGLVESEYGYHIIKCTDVFEGVSSVESLDDLPEALADAFKHVFSKIESEDDLDTWITTFKNLLDITINDMPKSVSYYVKPEEKETTSTTSSTSTTTTTDTSSTESDEESESE